MLRRICRGVMSLLAVVAALAVVGGLAPTAAAQQARLYVYPSPVAIDLGGAALVEVRTENIANLYGCHIELRYDPTKVRVRDADPNTPGVQVSAGSLFAGTNNFVALKSADPGAGLISFAVTLLNPEPAIGRSGSLLSFVLEGAAEGSSNLTFQKDELVSKTAQKIASTTEGAAVNVVASGGTPVNVTVTVGPTDTPVLVVVGDAVVTPTPASTPTPAATRTPAPTATPKATAPAAASPIATATPAAAAWPLDTPAPTAPTAVATVLVTATPLAIAAAPGRDGAAPTPAAVAASGTNWYLVVGIVLLGGGALAVAAMAWTALRAR